MSPRNRLRLSLIALSLTAAAVAARGASISNTFDAGAQGWLISDISSLPGSGSAAPWDAVNQRIHTPDIATWTVFSAPATYLGDLSTYYGGSFSFNLMDNIKDANADTVATFGISSGQTALFWFGGSASTVAMTSFVAGMSEADPRWRLGGLPTDINSGAVPTAAQFQGVLSAVTALRINADWKTAGVDQSDLDNVLLVSAPVPEPGSSTLLALGLAWLGWRKRRGAQESAAA